jgi:hypothetical protein
MPYFPELALRLFDLKAFDEIKAGAMTDEDIEVYKYTFSKKGRFIGPLNYYRANTKFLNPDPPTKRPETFAKGLYMLGEHEKYISKKTGKVIQKYYDNLEFKVIKGKQLF